jgi:hypothetical protein
MHGENKNAYWTLVGKPEGNRRLGRPRRRGEDNIKMKLKYDLAQVREKWWAFVNMLMKLREFLRQL